MAKKISPKTVLVAGASGYVGSRLIPRLLEKGYPVRALARSPEKIRHRPWATHSKLEIVQADLLDPVSLAQACEGCGSVFYLVHSLNQTSRNFIQTNRKAALNMVAAAEEKAVERIIYLKGPEEEGGTLSEQLGSGDEVAKVLQAGQVPLTVFRAAMIIGSGSTAFETLRYLVERLPVMITPRWVETACRPIAIRNVIHYLSSCLESVATIGETFDIGQEELVTYRQLIATFAAEAGLTKRLVIPFPVLAPRLSSYWIHMLTPIPALLGRPLADGLRKEVVDQDFRIRELLPQDLLDCRTAIALALNRTRNQQIESCWSDAGTIPPVAWETSAEPLYTDFRQILLAASAAEIWEAIVRIGGKNGWYYGTWLWSLRGFIDRIAGGIGRNRGRRSPRDLNPGDALDFWRVSRIEKPQVLQLVGEMKMPGQALLAFELEELAPDKTFLRIKAHFKPRGILGRLYWWAVTPLHAIIFNGMLNGISKKLERPIIMGPEKIQ